MNKIIRLKSISEVHKFYNLPKPKHPLISVIYFDEGVLNADYGEYTYVFDFFQISLKEGVKGKFAYGRNTYDFEEGTMAFLKPNQSIKIEKNNLVTNSGGWMLLVHPDLLLKSELSNKMKNYTFFSYDVNEALHISDEEKNIVNELVNKIEREYCQNIDRHSQTLILSNIELLLNYCSRFYDRQFYTRTNVNNNKVSDFENFIQQYFNKGQQLELGLPSVSDCGNALNMSPGYLSDLLKKETGISAQEHIHNHIVHKAKYLLLNSNDSISEIAFQLGYNYPQHFSKLFKSKTGLTPVNFRKLN